MTLDEAAEEALHLAGRTTATEAEVVGIESEVLEVGVRLQETEKLKRARERRIAVRMFVGQSSAVCSTADLGGDSLRSLVETCQSLARSTAPDPFAGLPDGPDRSPSVADLALYDESAERVSAEEAIAVALAAEQAALAADSRITNSEGAEFECAIHRLIYRTTRGVAGSYRTTSFSLSVVPVAAHEGRMQQDYWYTTGRRRADLDSPESVGRTAATRALRRLGARPVSTREVPVVFDPEMAATLVGHFAAAASGSSVYRGLSFLGGRLGQPVGGDEVTLIDDPLLPGRLGSRPFDAEGMPTRRNVVAEHGVLRTYLLDTYAARKLGMTSTASAVRSFGDVPSAGSSNFYLERGPVPPEEIVASVRDGFYVTELSGFGVNPVTGDYSRGAGGLWIESGKLTFPVEEVTIAGNLLEMLTSVEVIGNDLRFRSRTASPTLKIRRMTVAGAG
ncbi:MAG: TldD/PmbA family protein [Candidatus Binatia bacterium]